MDKRGQKPDRAVIEVTPEMVEAGLAILSLNGGQWLPDWVDRETFLKSVFVAMQENNLSGETAKGDCETQ